MLKNSPASEAEQKNGEQVFPLFKSLIHARQKNKKGKIPGGVEVDESFLGPSRGGERPGPEKRDRGTLNTTGTRHPRKGRPVCTGLITDYAVKTLQAISRGKIDPESVIHSNGWKGCDGLLMLAMTSISGSTGPNALPIIQRMTMAERLAGALPEVALPRSMA